MIRMSVHTPDLLAVWLVIVGVFWKATERIGEWRAVIPYSNRCPIREIDRRFLLEAAVYCALNSVLRSIDFYIIDARNDSRTLLWRATCCKL
jgi:hypothetical protein